MAVPPKGRPIRGPAAKRSSIADEPNTKYLSETLQRFVKLSAESQCSWSMITSGHNVRVGR